MKKIITLTTEGGDREDGSVYYAQSILVDSGGALTTLKFDEDVFTSARPSAGPYEGSYDEAIAAIRALGYTVEELENVIVHCDSDGCDDDYDDYDDEDEEEDEE